MERKTLIGLGGLVAAGAAIRAYQLDSGLWFDEIATLVGPARQPLWNIVSGFEGDNDHKLYSLLAHLSMGAFGEHAWSLRLPAVIFGIMTIPLLYSLGRMVAGRREGILAACILTVSYHHVWFSQNARAYTMLLFLTVLSTMLLLKWFETRAAGLLAAYAAVIAIGTYAHLSMAFVAAAHALVCAWWLLDSDRAEMRVRDAKALAIAFLAGALLTILLYLPALPEMYAYFTRSVPSAASEVATPAWAIVAALEGLRAGFGALWAIGAGAMVFLAGVASYWKTRRAALLMFLVPPSLMLAALLVLGRPIRPRFLFFAIGFGLLIVLRGATALGEWIAGLGGPDWARQRAGAISLALVAVAAIAFSIRSLPYGYRYPKQDYLSAVQFVESSKQAGDQTAVVGVTSAIPVIDYLGRPWDRIEEQGDIDRLRETGSDTWVVYTFPEYIEADQPDLWATLIDQCEPMEKFEGTVAGGGISVSRCRAASRPVEHALVQ